MALWLLITTLFMLGSAQHSQYDFIHSTSDGEQLITTLHTYEPTICDSNVQQYSGYLYAGGQNGTNNNYFYWFFESRNNPQNDPLIMWLQGGPGCSSQVALLAENGPCHIINNGSLINDTILNPYSWNSNANIMFVDQPPQTGYSTGSRLSTLDEISKDMWIFLQHFMYQFPQYFQNGFFISGESYAGHYIPNIVNYIYQQNKHNPKRKIPLTGFAIGNGLTDPLAQIPFYAQMAYNSSAAINSHFDGIPLTHQAYQQMENNITNCIPLMKTCYVTRAIDTCHNATECWKDIVFYGQVKATGVNRYNLDTKCEKEHLCYDFIALDNWLNLDTVQTTIGVAPSIKWKECNFHVAHLIEPSGSTLLNSRPLLQEALDNGMRGLIFAGDLDFVCNWLGNQEWTLQLQWKGQESFRKAKMTEWTVNDKVAGEIRQGNNTNFSFVRIYNAGHMVPMDQPEVALELINQFIWDTLRSDSSEENEMSDDGDSDMNSNNYNRIDITINISPTTVANLWGIVFLFIMVVICGWLLCQNKL